MKEPISGETFFEEFIEQIEWNQEAVAVENPYPPEQIVSMAFANIEKSGIYPEDCCDWTRKPRVDKTWVNFKIRFSRAFKEAHRSSQNAQNLYAANVVSAEANALLFAEMQQDHTASLANLATATQSDWQSVALLTRTIAYLTAQVAVLTTTNERLSRATKRPNSSSTIVHPRLAADHLRDQNIYSRSSKRFNLNGYYSSHGLKVEDITPQNEPDRMLITTEKQHGWIVKEELNGTQLG